MIDRRAPVHLLLALVGARLTGRPAPVACLCTNDDTRDCHGTGLPRSERGLCSCRCHGAETMPPTGLA